MVNLFVHFRSKSSQVHLKQVHKSNVGQVQHSVSTDEPHYLRHEIQKPVIQTIREVIVPYRQVIQEIKPVVEEVKTVVPTGVPRSTIYMNFGHKYSDPTTNPNYDSYRYVMNTNQESPPLYTDSGVSQHSPVQTSSSTTSSSNPSSLYDLSSIYGIKPTLDQSMDYLTPSQYSQNHQDSQINQGYNSPLIYGLTTDIQTEPGTFVGYNVNTIHENSAENNQNSGYREPFPSYQKAVSLEENQSPLYNNLRHKSYDQNYNFVENIEPQYYVTQNNENSNKYYSDSYESQSTDNSRYATQHVINPGYSDEYSGDLATSDGNPSIVSPMFGPFNNIPITKSTTLSSLAHMISTLPYQYSYENAMTMKRNA